MNWTPKILLLIGGRGKVESSDTGFQVHTPSILHCLVFSVGAAHKLSRFNTPLFLVLLLSGWAAE